MATDEKHGFYVNQGRIALVISIVTLLTLGFQASRFLLDTTYRIVALEEKWVGISDSQKELTRELGRLAQSLNDLNVVLREVQVRQQEEGDSK